VDGSVYFYVVERATAEQQLRPTRYQRLRAARDLLPQVRKRAKKISKFFAWLIVFWPSGSSVLPTQATDTP
jgi:hypothetical protein